MSVARKYNPGFLSDNEVVASFCVRTSEFESMMEMLRECTGASNSHQIVIGPRGSGKTTLLLRVAAEVRRDAELSESFFPIVFAEESYEVATAGEFWLECLGRLAVQAPQRHATPDLHRTYAELCSIRDDRSLGDRCLGALLDFSDRENKRLVLIAENLNTMFRDMTDEDAGWRLRKVLQTEPRIILLASATNRFDQIDNPDEALYEIFRVLPLRPLDTAECAVLWETVTGQTARVKAIRALHILVGGSPRLFVIFARFGAGMSFRRLMADLLDLVDDHTEYFRSHLEMLAPQERRVYLALADLWKPATTSEIADRARLDTSKCSAQLARLVERQIVQVTGGTARRKQYYLAERLYNIYHLLRRPRGPDRLVESLVRFMASYYSPRELTAIGAEIVRETDGLDGGMPPLQQAALQQLLNGSALGKRRGELLEMIPPSLSEVLGLRIPPSDKPKPESTGPKPTPSQVDPLPGDQADTSTERLGRDLLERARAVRKLKRPEAALAAYDEIVRRFGDSEAPALAETVAEALFEKGAMLGALNRPEETIATCDEVVQRYGESNAPSLLATAAKALFNRGVALGKLNRPEEALMAYDEVVRRYGEHDAPLVHEIVARALTNRGITLDELNRPEEALVAYGELVRRFGTAETPILVEMVATAHLNRGFPLQALNRPEEALAAFDEVVRRHDTSETPDLLEMVAKALVSRGGVLRAMDRLDEALAAFDEVIVRFGASESPAVAEAVASAFCDKGATLGMLNRPVEALAALDEVLNRYGTSEAPGLLVVVTGALVNKALALQRRNRPEEALPVLDEVIRRCGTSEGQDVALLANALVNRGITLAALDRPEEALRAYDQVVRRFGSSNVPVALEWAASALLHKGVQLVTLSRPEQALAVFDEVVLRFGGSEAPALRQSVATALVNKGMGLAALNRPEEALATYREVVHRFRTNEAPATLQRIARALMRIGGTLRDLHRSEEALVAFDEVVSRFGESGIQALRLTAAHALVDKGATLHGLQRPEEALAAYDEVVRRFGNDNSPAMLEEVTTALVHKGDLLALLNQREEALATYGEVVDRCEKESYLPHAWLAEHALLKKAGLEFECRRQAAAIRTAGRVIEEHRTESGENLLRGHVIRARATLANGDPAGCEHDITASLSMLPQLDSIPIESVYALIELGLELGPARAIELIRASPSADLLLPLTTAFEQELGLEPRVALEVEAVARDIQRTLQDFQNAR